MFDCCCLYYGRTLYLISNSTQIDKLPLALMLVNVIAKIRI